MSDTTAPMLNSISLSTSSLNIGANQKTLLVTAHFTDDLSGIFDGTFADGSGGSGPQIRFVSPSGQIVDGVFDILHPVSGNRLDGVYQASVTLDTSAEAGLWQVGGLLLNDEAGNNAFLSPANSAALAAISFTVTNSASDTTPPTLTGLTFPTTVDLSHGSQTITFGVSATDDLSGPNYALIQLAEPIVEQFSNGSTTATNLQVPYPGSLSTGQTTQTFTLSPNTASGTYTIQDIVVYDNAGNSQTYTTQQLQALGAPTSFTVTNRITPTGPNPFPPGDTSADMILRHDSDGLYEIYNVGDSAILAGYSLGQVGIDWQFAGLGAFNGNDAIAMLLRNSGTGGFETYDIVNNNITSAASLGRVGLNWQVAGFGNFSSSPGETDMLLRDVNTGTFEVYDISNDIVRSASAIGQVDLSWQVAGFGDFNKDGSTDMMLRNSSTGAFEVNDIINNQITSANSAGVVGLDWKVAGFGDFNNDGSTDMMLRNSSTGMFEVYDIVNNFITSASAIGAVGLEWQVAGFGPMHGPGSSDMVLRNTNTGAFEVYDIANNQITGARLLGAVGLDWQTGGFAPTAHNTAPQVAQLVQAMAAFSDSGTAAVASSPISQASLDATLQTGAISLSANSLGAAHV